MSIPLIDWLYNDDNIITPPTQQYSTQHNYVSKQGALIMFPRMIDRWNITSLIVSKWEQYKVVIITDHPDEFTDTLIDLSNNNISCNTRSRCGSNTVPLDNWKDLELIMFPLIKYSDIIEINRALYNTEIDIIIFDDARMLATIIPALDFSAISSHLSTKIIVLSTWGDSIDQLTIITDTLPYLHLLSIDFINEHSYIDWKTIRIPLSDRQLHYYYQARSLEINDNNSKIRYPITRMLTLYAYPDSIMKDTLVHKSICEMDLTSFPDNIDRHNSWINSSYISHLDRDGPKLSSILDGII